MERIIDFHTHIFPDKMAVKTVEFLAERGGIPAYADGTLADIQAKADEANVTLSISLPVLTRPESFDSVLNFAKSIAPTAKARKLKNKPKSGEDVITVIIHFPLSAVS